MVTEYTIQPSSSTQDEYIQTATDSQFDTFTDAITEAQNNGYTVFELGRDQLPVDVQDIRGKIHNQAGRIYAAVKISGWQLSSESMYFALVPHR